MSDQKCSAFNEPDGGTCLVRCFRPAGHDGTHVEVPGTGTRADPWIIPAAEPPGWGWVDPKWHLPAGHYVFLADGIEQPAHLGDTDGFV